MIGRIALALALLPGAALAGSAWDDIARELYADAVMEPAGKNIELSAPFRTMTDSRTILGASVRAPDGTGVTTLTLVIDENPMPVSAVIRFAEPQADALFELTTRLNGPTPVHAIAELTDGRVIVADSFVKTSGEGACAAPPVTDPVLALETLGRIDVGFGALPAPPDATAAERLGALGRRIVDVAVSHPSHSGMQRDQITLLYIPMRYVSELALEVDGKPYAQMTGSISISENPRLRLSLPAGASEVSVTMTDTDGTLTTESASLHGS